ncbi:FRG domain-containing protein [Paeniclostridium sordellii]|nr:FRG domain-containing protein [Paeniclostridium sordellii]MSB60510.1 FRG domain-containing protein [Paeniclostridium sordellii]
MGINNVQEFISKLPELTMKTKGNLFYRGQSNIDYKLEPSVFRGNAKGKEDKIYLKVLTECSNEFDTNMTHIDIISKMQHYGVYTRLLDVTTNALVSLYFACEGEKNKDKDGCVYIFNPDENNIKSFDSDTISILSSVPRFNEDDKYELRICAEQYYDDIDDFNQQPVVRRLLHEVKKEKPAFENIIKPKDLLNNYFLLPKKDNPRIIRQSGAFIICGLNENKVVEPYKKIKIPSGSKDIILEQLKCFGISKATLHPELYKVAEYIKDSINNKVYFL